MAVNHYGAGTGSIDRLPSGARLAAFALLLVSLLGFTALIQPLPAWAVTGESQQLLNLINQERAAVGAQALTVRDDLVQIAAEHSAWMASTGNFQHRSDLSVGVTGPWAMIGENIAYGWSVSNIHRMFMESKGHCENNLYSGFNRVGIESAIGGNGAIYITVVFVQESGGSLPRPTVCPYDYSTTTTTAPPVATTSTTAPPVTTTTTTAPPVTTTTTTAPPVTTTTTTAPPVTTTAPPATTTTSAAEAATNFATVVEIGLPIPATTTTTVPPSVTSYSLPTSSVDDQTASAVEGRFSEAIATDEGRATVPVVPVAGGVAFLAGIGVWFTTTKRATAQAIVSRWETPHSRVRPPL